MSVSDTPHLTEVCTASEALFKGEFLHAQRDTVRLPDGSTGVREYIKHPGAVVIVAWHDDGQIVIERQYRYPVAQVITEFPAGKLDAGEAPLACGQRELLEETGYTARQWAYAGRMHLAIGYSDEVIHIYFARGLSAGERSLDEGEFLDVDRMSVPALLQAVRDGGITDAKTLSCMNWVTQVASGAWALDWQDA